MGRERCASNMPLFGRDLPPSLIELYQERTEAMTSTTLVDRRGPRTPRFAVLLSASLLFGMGAAHAAQNAPSTSAPAATAPAPAGSAATPVTDFRSQLADVRKSL